MGQDLQKSVLSVPELLGRAAMGEEMRGVPHTAELMRRVGMHKPGITAPALAAPSVALGKVFPIAGNPKTSESAKDLLAVVEEVRRAAMGSLRWFSGAHHVSARAAMIALPFEDYLQAIRNRRSLRDQLQRKIDRNEGDISVLAYDEPELLRFVGKMYDNIRHTPDTAGYKNYLQDVSPLYRASVGRIGSAPLTEAVREEHTYITGSPGSGKTELLKALLLNDVEKGNACIVIDPTGNFARSVARWPEFAGAGSQRLAYFAPNLHTERVAIFNPLDASHLTPEGRAVMASQLVEVLARSLGRGDWSSQAGTLASNCFHVLMEMGKPDFFFLMRALVGTDAKGKPRTEEAREMYRRGLAHPFQSVRQFFEYDFFDTQFATTKSSVRGKLDDLLKDPTFVDAVTGKSTLNIEEEVNAGRVVIFDLGDWRSREGMGAFGRMVLAQVVAYGLRRGRKAGLGEKHRPVHVYVDEVSRFVGPAIVDALVFLRQYGIHMTMAQPTPGDGFEPDAKKNLFTSTAIKFAAGSGQRDMLADMGAPADATQGLKKGEFIGRWGHNTEPFKLTVRNDRADFSKSMRQDEWEAVMFDQLARYYRPRVDPTPARPQSDPRRPPRPKRPLRRI